MTYKLKNATFNAFIIFRLIPKHLKINAKGINIGVAVTDNQKREKYSQHEKFFWQSSKPHT